MFSLVAYRANTVYDTSYLLTVLTVVIQGLLLPAGGVVTLICRLAAQPCVLQPLIQKL